MSASKPNLKEIVSKLTAKQRKFAEGLVYGGLSKAEAYRQAYKWGGNSPNGMRVDAVKTAKSPNVSLAIKAMEEDRVARWWESKQKLQTYIMDGITQTANSTESDITRLKAYELLGKTRYASIFEEPQANESTTNLHNDICDMIQAKLANLLAPDITNMIDITPTNKQVTKSKRVTKLPVTELLGDGVSEAGDTQPPTGGGEGE